MAVDAKTTQQRQHSPINPRTLNKRRAEIAQIADENERGLAEFALLLLEIGERRRQADEK